MSATVAGIHMIGLSGAKPAASAVGIGSLYFATDTGTLERSNGTIWESYQPGSAPPSGAAGGVLSGTYPNPGFAADMATQAELDAVDAAIAAHIADAAAAHAASAIAFTPAGTIAATDVQAALEEVAADASAGGTGLSDHIADTIDAHDASAISFTPAGGIAATDVQAAIAEVESEAATALSNHTGDITAAHAASAIAVTPFGTIAATDVQAALEEVVAEAAGGGLPAGGTAGQALVKQSGVDGDADWVDFSVDPVPADLVGSGMYVASAHDEETETLRLFISRDGKAWRPINHTPYTAPSAGVVRDPSITRYRNRWWICHTARGGAFDIIVSDDLVNWTHHVTVSMGGSYTGFVWAPEWYLDNDGLRVFVTSDPSGSDSFVVLEVRPTNDAMTTWSAPTVITITGGPSNIIDVFVTKDESGTYQMIYKDERPGFKHPNRATATSLLGPYTEVDDNMIGVTNIEGYNVVRFGPGAWRMYYNVILTDGVSYKESFDDLVTWGSAAAVTGVDDFSHCTVLLVRDPAVVAAWFETMITADGDILVGAASGAIESLAMGAPGTVFGVSDAGSLGYHTIDNFTEGSFINPMTAKGDLIVGRAVDASVDFAAGIAPTVNRSTNFGTLAEITDGNDGTVFAPLGPGNGTAYTIDLGVAREIINYRLVQSSAGAGWRSSNYTIESSMDASSWITRYTRPGTDAVDSGVVALTSPGTGRYWRWTAPNTGGNGWNQHTFQLLGGVAAGDPERLAVGANGTVLTADSAEVLGVKWAAPTVLDDAVDINYVNTTSGLVATNVQAAIDELDGLIAGGGILNNYAAAADPTANDDSGDGYAVGSRWINTVANTDWVCVDATPTAAIWEETTAAGGGGGHTIENTGTPLAARTGLNFIPGATGITVTDNAGADQTDVDFSALAIGGIPTPVLASSLVMAHRLFT